MKKTQAIVDKLTNIEDLITNLYHLFNRVNNNKLSNYKSINEICEELGISKPTFYRLRKAKNIKCSLNLGKQKRFDIDLVRQALQG